MSREQFVFLGCHLAIAKGLLDGIIPTSNFTQATYEGHMDQGFRAVWSSFNSQPPCR